MTIYTRLESFRKEVESKYRAYQNNELLNPILKEYYDSFAGEGCIKEIINYNKFKVSYPNSSYVNIYYKPGQDFKGIYAEFDGRQEYPVF